MHLACSTPRRFLRRKACSAVTLVSYLCATVGLPMPLAAGKPGEAAFPCQMLLCGCLTAEQCQNCGCFTPQEQAAWAAAHNVAPSNPDGEENKPSSCCCDASQESPNCPHCVKKARSSCCAPKSKPTSCQSRPEQSCADTHTKDKKSVRWGGVSAGRCHGMALSWVTTGAAVPAAPPAAWQPCLPFTGWLAATGIASVKLSQDPLDPPPRA